MCACVIYMVICASFYLDFRLFKVRSLRSRGGDFTVRSFHSRDLACLDYPNISAPIGRNICLADAFLCLLLPNDIRVLFHEKALFLRFTFSFTPLIPCLLPPREERETTERTTAQLPALQKCYFLIFAIANWLFSARGYPREFPSVLIPLCCYALAIPIARFPSPLNSKL